MFKCHPFCWIKEESQKKVFWVWFTLTILVIVGMQVTGGPLGTEAAPGGIITYEFAGNMANSQAILDSWDAEAKVWAGLNLGLDYLFMAAYAGAIGLGCVVVGRGLSKMSAGLGSLGNALAWGLLAAALLDAVENFALIRLLVGCTNTLWPVLAKWCAIPKFALVAAGLVYVIAGAAAGVVRK